MKFNSFLGAVCGGAIVASGSVSAQQTSSDATQTLPPAKAGECWVKAMIPAEYKTETVEVVKKQASEKIEIIPAKYEEVEETVLVKDASFKLVPKAAEYADAVEKIEVRPAAAVWVDGKGDKAAAADDGVVQLAGSMGANVTGATPGQCFAEYTVSAKTKTEKVRVLVKEETETIEVVPPKWEWAEERVLVKEASRKVVDIPAVYETVSEKVLVSPATTVWKQGRGPVERIDNTTGEIMCLVEIPAEYKTVEKRVVKTPAGTKVEEIPAEYATEKVRKLVAPASEKRTKVPAQYTEVDRTTQVSGARTVWAADGAGPSDAEGAKTTGRMICLKQNPAEFKEVKKRVIKSPPSVQKVEVPAEYKKVKVRKLVSPAQEKRIAVPEEKQKVSKRVKLSDDKLEWRQVLCETNMSRDLITRIQRALLQAGHNPGPIDGNVGQATLRAAEKYQVEKGLPRGGLTMATLKALGVSI